MVTNVIELGNDLETIWIGSWTSEYSRFAGVQMPAGGNVIKRTHPGSDVFVVLNMEGRGEESSGERDKEGRNRKKEDAACRVGTSLWLWLAGL